MLGTTRCLQDYTDRSPGFLHIHFELLLETLRATKLPLQEELSLRDSQKVGSKFRDLG